LESLSGATQGKYSSYNENLYPTTGPQTQNIDHSGNNFKGQ